MSLGGGKFLTPKVFSKENIRTIDLFGVAQF